MNLLKFLYCKKMKALFAALLSMMFFTSCSDIKQASPQPQAMDRNAAQYQAGLQAIQQGDYQTATDKLYLFIYNKTIYEDSEVLGRYAYAKKMYEEKAGSPTHALPLRQLQEIEDIQNYSGAFADEVIEFYNILLEQDTAHQAELEERRAEQEIEREVLKEYQEELSKINGYETMYDGGDIKVLYKRNARLYGNVDLMVAVINDSETPIIINSSSASLNDAAVKCDIYTELSSKGVIRIPVEYTDEQIQALGIDDLFKFDLRLSITNADDGSSPIADVPYITLERSEIEKETRASVEINGQAIVEEKGKVVEHIETVTTNATGGTPMVIS